MNAFALVLLAFPFYLMTKGRLVPTYTQLATSGSGAATSTSQQTSAPLNVDMGGENFGLTTGQEW